MAFGGQYTCTKIKNGEKSLMSTQRTVIVSNGRCSFYLGGLFIGMVFYKSGLTNGGNGSTWRVRVCF